MKLTFILLLSCLALIFLPKILNYGLKPAHAKPHARRVAASPSTVEIIQGTRKTVSTVNAAGDSDQKQ